MTKRKSRTCSTGHNTGMQYIRGLHERLIQEKARKTHKRNKRIMNRLHVEANHMNQVG